MKRTIYNEEHEAFRRTMRAFLAKAVIPHLESWQHAGCAPHSLYAELGKLGVTGFDIPE